MVGCGKARATWAGPADDIEQMEQAPQYLVDFLAPLAVRMQAIEDSLTGGSDSSPRRRQSVLPQVLLVAPVVDQESWLCLIERFQKLKEPEFQGGSDPLVADK